MNIEKILAGAALLTALATAIGSGVAITALNMRITESAQQQRQFDKSHAAIVAKLSDTDTKQYNQQLAETR